MALVYNKDYGPVILDIAKAAPILIKSRFEALFLWVWQLTIMIMVVTHGFPPLGTALLTIISGTALVTSTYIYNDYADADMDRLNPLKVKRSALAAGIISKKSALVIIIISAVIGLSSALLVNFETFIFGLFFFVLFMSYSYPRIRLKKRFLVKEIVTTSGLPIFALMASYAMTGTFSLTAIFASLLFGQLGILVLPVVSDTLDENEDKAFEVKSLARALSWKRRVQLMGVGMLVMMTVVPLTYSQFGLSVIFPISVVILSLILLRWGIYPIRTKADVESITRSRKLTIVYYLVAEIILVLSTLSLNIKLF